MSFTRTFGGVGGRFDWHRGGAGADALWFFCPGCDLAHRVEVSGERAWRWNGDVDAPTLDPSVLCITGAKRCHSFLRSGRLEFLDDSTHELRGRTVEVPTLPDWMRD